MSKIATVENGAVYEGYDYSTAAEWCSPSFLGCSVCVGASAVKGLVTISMSLKTPFGNVSKSFSFNSDVSYTWQPFGKFKITISITNFNEADGVFSFDLGVNPCIDIPILGWKCFMYNHHFNVPLLLTGIQNDIDDSQFASVLAFHSGNGFNDASGSSLLQGDIYNNYLNSQAGIPTLPVASCIPTRQCVPTITSCVTGIPYICNSALGADTANAANIPTVPVNQCIPTVQCVPTLSCIPTVSCTGIPFICSSAVQGGYPTTLLPGCQHMTTLLPGCQSGGVQGTEANANDIPTLPVASCIPTRQCVPTITSCVTGIPYICNSAIQGTQDTNANAANIPTVPVNQCIPTVQCVPTLSCIPTVSCTGIPFICNSAVQAQAYPTTLLPNCHHMTTLLPGCQSGGLKGANANAGDIPTLPVASCIPTRQCVPTITSCVTGIPYICNSAAQAYPTTLLPNCHHMTTLLPGCQHPTTFLPGCQHVGADANVAAIPTLPVSQCVNTASCFPTLPCLPTVSCTGIPIVC